MHILFLFLFLLYHISIESLNIVNHVNNVDHHEYVNDIEISLQIDHDEILNSDKNMIYFLYGNNNTFSQFQILAKDIYHIKQSNIFHIYDINEVKSIEYYLNIIQNKQDESTSTSSTISQLNIYNINEINNINDLLILNSLHKLTDSNRDYQYSSIIICLYWNNQTNLLSYASKSKSKSISKSILELNIELNVDGDVDLYLEQYQLNKHMKTILASYWHHICGFDNNEFDIEAYSHDINIHALIGRINRVFDYSNINI